MTGHEKVSNKEDLIISAALFATCVVGYSLLCVCCEYVTYDGLIYIELAINIFKTGFETLGSPHTKFLPLYPALMSILDMATFHAFEMKVMGFIVNILCGASIPVIIYLFGRKAGTSKLISLIVASGHMIIYFGLDQYKDVTVMPLFAFEIALLFFVLQKEKWFLAGLIAGLATVTRYEIYPLLPIIFFMNMKNIKAVFLIIAGFSITALPWYIRTLIVYNDVIHTKYFIEILFYPELHHIKIALGLILAIGPALLLGFFIGVFKLERKLMVCMVWSIFSYLIVHVFWWFYDDRFLLVVSPLILMIAAPGMENIFKWSENKTNIDVKMVVLLVALISLLPVGIRSSQLMYRDLTAPPDPYRLAALSLKDEPEGSFFIGANFPVLYAHSRHLATTWSDIPEGRSPYQHILAKYKEWGINIVVWSDHYTADTEIFGFLKDGLPVKVMVEDEEGKYRLSFLYLREYNSPTQKVYIYQLKVEKIE